MIFYRPTDGDVDSSPILSRPKTCFLMMQLGHPMPPILQKIRTSLTGILAEQNIRVIDANSITTGHDFLNKIWKLIISVPMGIAIIHEDITIKTYGNIFYELGMMQAYGKETLVIKAKDIQMPSDFVRTEYVLYDGNFESHIRCFLNELKERADHYALMAKQARKESSSFN